MRKKVLLLVIMGVIVLTGCSNKSTSSINKESSDINVVINEIDDVDIKYDYSINKDLLLTAKNKDETNLSIAVFDKDNKLIKTENKYLYDNMNSTYKIYISDVIKKVRKIEITPNKIKNHQKFQHYESYIKLDYNEDKSNRKIIVNVSNASGEIIDNISYLVYFYKDNKLIDILEDSSSNIGETSSHEIYMPAYKTKNGSLKILDYDKIDIKVDSAIKYINE